MVNIIRTRRNSIGGSTSPRSAEVGEIDTKAPFQSVKAAVSLFGEASSSSPKAKPQFTKKPKPQAQAVLDKEAQFHLALNELNKLKEQLRGAESKKNEALPELDKAQRTLDDLQLKLKSVNESKHSILETSEALKERARKLEEAISSSDIDKANDVVDFVKQDVDITREEYKASILELDVAKQQLSNMHREYDSTLEAKASAFRISQEADAAADAHRQRVSNLTKQIATMQEALTKIKSSSKRTEEEQHKLLAQKHEKHSSHRLAKQELENKILSLKNEHRSILGDDDLQVKLEKTNAEILTLKEKVSKAQAAFLESQKASNYELEVAKKSLEKVDEEKISLQASVESLKEELENVRKEISEQKRKQQDADASVSKLRAELDDKKSVLEAGLFNKTSAADASDDMAISIEQLTLETEKAKQEAEQIKKKIEEQRQETQTTREMIAEMEVKLESLLKEVEEAKTTEKAAQDEIKALSERPNMSTDEESTSESNGKIKLSSEEYNSLMEKVDESEKLADIKVTANFAQVGALVASQKEAAQKYEAMSKEIEELKMREEEALKIAEMAEAAKSALETELHRRYQLDSKVESN